MSKFLNYIKENYRETALVSTITLFALILRLILLNNYGDLWLDELYSWYFASKNSVFATVFELFKQDVHMPLYFVILHFWIKIFGQSDTSMHLCTLFLTLPLIPISFYIAKNLFNKATGYFASIIMALSGFCIYYSIEVRFYGLVFILALLSAFYFAKMLDKYEKEYAIGFLISHLMLIYTFSITGLLTIVYALVAGVYVFVKKPEILKKIVLIFLILFLLSLPAIIAMIMNILVFNNQICSFTKDIYVFSWAIILNTLEGIFSQHIPQITTGAVNVYSNLLENIKSVNYVVFVLIPVLIGVLGVIKGLLSKDKKFYLFFLPSLIFSFLILICSSLGLIASLVRYITIVFPIFVCSACYGLTLFTRKTSSIIIFSVWILLNYTYFYVFNQNIFTSPKSECVQMTELLRDYVKINDNDYVLIPYSGNKIKRYVSVGKFIDFQADDMLLLKDKKSYQMYFGDVFVSRENVRNILKKSIQEDTIFETYNQNLKNRLKDIKKGDKLIIISYRNGMVSGMNANWQYLKSDEYYENMNLFMLIISKVMRDSIAFANKNFEYVNSYSLSYADYVIWVYEKR